MSIVVRDGDDSTTAKVDSASRGVRAHLVDPSGNPLAATEFDFPSSIEGLPIIGQTDGNIRSIRTDRFGNIGTSVANPVIWEQMEGAVLNTQRWVNTATTFVTAQNAQGINLNNTNLTTANAVNVLISRKRISRISRNPIQVKFRARLSNFANSVNEVGVADGVTGTTQILNGVYFQCTTLGAVQGVVALNGVETVVTLNTFGGFTYNANAGEHYTFDILIDDDSVDFFIQTTASSRIVARGTFKVPNNAQRMIQGTKFLAFSRCFNSATVPATAPVHILNFFYMGFTELQISKPWPDILAGNSQHGRISPTAFTQTAQFANSAAPASATLSNTAAGYTTLGGLFQFAAIAGAATDYLLFSFTVPAPYSLHVKGITIESWNTGAAVATTPTLLVWGFGTNGTAANLGTGGFIRGTLGSQSFPVAAAVGANTNQINRRFEVPLVIEPGLILAIILRMPVGTATASQIVQGLVDIDGYFE
jgi:hypothetical protein